MTHRIGVIGAGYVGLTTSACLAHLGHEVICADIDEGRIQRLQRGEVPILEEQLPELVTQGLESGRLRFVVGAAAAAEAAEFVLLCVPTPRAQDGHADMSYVEAVCREIAPVLQSGVVVINRSTMPVGSVREVHGFLAATGAGLHEVEVVANPEFLSEGHAVREFLAPTRIVIGCDSPAAAVRVAALYGAVQAPVIVTSPESAEMIKYAANAFLATRVSFINAIANLCERVGADVKDVALGMGHDPRIGGAALNPGPGFGGSCLPKDTAALLQVAVEVDYDFDLLRTVIAVNERQRDQIVRKVERALDRPIDGARIAIWGLAFKAGTNDLRDSPALDVAHRLAQEGALVRAFDPAITDHVDQSFQGIEVAADAYDVCKAAEGLVVLTEWDEFRWLNFGRVRELMDRPVIIDARNLLDPTAMRRHGFFYSGIGR